MHFHGRVVQRSDLPSLTNWEREHLGELTAETYQVLRPPRCHLNHSCSPSAVSTHDTDCAWRDISAGEEMTLDYRLNANDDGDVWETICHCEARDEAHAVIGDFFSMPEGVRRESLPYAPAFIQDEPERRETTQ